MQMSDILKYFEYLDASLNVKLLGVCLPPTLVERDRRVGNVLGVCTSSSGGCHSCKHLGVGAARRLAV